MFRNSSGGGPIRQRRRRVRAPRQLTFKVSMLKSSTISHCRSHRGEFTYMNTFLNNFMLFDMKAKIYLFNTSRFHSTLPYCGAA